MARLIHIVPSMPPEINGLGDYTHQLWRYWPKPRPDWQIAGARIPAGAAQAWPEVKIHSFELNETSLSAVLESSRSEVAILHYVGYAYAKRGAPFWMPGALEHWKQTPGRELVVMFHELYATGPPWHSEFWFMPSQLHIVKQLIDVADRWICSCPSQYNILVDELGADPSVGARIPVGSNIDPVREPDWSRPWPLSNGRKLRMVVFGQALTRLRSLRAHQHLLRELCRREMVENILLVGKSSENTGINSEIEHIVAGIGERSLFESAFDLPPAEISELLLRGHLGLMTNTFGILAKSGVFAAYCTHNMLSLIPMTPGSPDGPWVFNYDSRPLFAVEALSGADALRGMAAIKPFGGQLSWGSIASAWSQTISTGPPPE